VYEDSNTAIQCLKVNDTSCASECPANMYPARSGSGWECLLRACEERVPENGICSMPGDIGPPCFSLVELNACYSSCPEQTTANSQTPGNARCTLSPCASRTPDSRGLCHVVEDDECFVYRPPESAVNDPGTCVVMCPPGTEEEHNPAGGGFTGLYCDLVRYYTVAITITFSFIGVCVTIACANIDPTAANGCGSWCYRLNDACYSVCPDNYKVENDYCVPDCPANMDPVSSADGPVCQNRACSERVPVIGACSMPGDMSLCYSLEETYRCYSDCPTHTLPETIGSPKCVPVPCSTREPDSRGSCRIYVEDQCHIYNEKCVKECPLFYEPNEDEV
jgi:hypothetical protein